MPLNKLKLISRLFVTPVAMFMPALLLAFSSGPDDGLTNSPPNRSNCTACHSSFGLNSGQGSLSLANLPESYEPGETYRLTLALADPNARRWGFELTALTANNSRAGNIAVVNQQATQLSNNNNQPQYLKHRRDGTFQGQANNASWQFDWTAPAEGTGRISFYFCGNASNNNGNTSGDRIYATAHPLDEAEPPPPPPPPPDSIMVTLAPGWNLISSPVAPDSTALTFIFGQMIEAGSLVVVRDAAGRRFFPAGELDEIGDWSILASYEIKATDNAEIKFSGSFVDPSQSYTIVNGWNWISYPRLDTLHPAQIVEQLGNADVLIRDGQGRFAVPAAGISNLQMILPGSGLQFLSSAEEPFDFVWPEPNPELEPPAVNEPPMHFGDLANTGSSMSILISGWELLGAKVNGDEVGVFASTGQPVGAAVVNGDQALLTLWGDDITSEEIEGATEGDSLIFKYWYSEGDSEETSAAYGRDGERLIFRTEMFEEIVLRTPVPNSVEEAPFLSPESFRLTGTYPNPFNPTTEVSFHLAKGGLVSINLFDNSGKQIRELGVIRYEAGEHTLMIDGAELPAGVYLVGLETNGVKRLARVVLLK